MGWVLFGLWAIWIWLNTFCILPESDPRARAAYLSVEEGGPVFVFKDWVPKILRVIGNCGALIFLATVMWATSKTVPIYMNETEVIQFPKWW